MTISAIITLYSQHVTIVFRKVLYFTSQLLLFIKEGSLLDARYLRRFYKLDSVSWPLSSNYVPKLQFHCGRLLRLHYDCCIVKDVEQKVVAQKTTRETMWSISIRKNSKIINASSQATTPIIVPVHYVVISGQTWRYLQCISVSCMFLVCHYFAKIVEPIKIVFFLSLLYYPFFHPICHHFKRAIWSAAKVITIHFVCNKFNHQILELPLPCF